MGWRPARPRGTVRTSTASPRQGEPYDMYGVSAAHKTIPLGTRVRVNNLTNGNQVVCMINDRGPFVGDRIIDMSYGAARKLGMVDAGLARVRVEVLEMPRYYSGGRYTHSSAPSRPGRMPCGSPGPSSQEDTSQALNRPPCTAAPCTASASGRSPPWTAHGTSCSRLHPKASPAILWVSETRTGHRTTRSLMRRK